MTEEKDFKAELAKRAALAEKIISGFLPEENGFYQTLSKSVNYSVQVGGKRLRPIIMKETFDLFGGTEETICHFMAAMEMIHSGSLVHDDLPCMDNDEYRRGKHTTWYVYHEDMATLAGDDLFIYPFEVAAAARKKTSDPGRVLRAIEVLAFKADHNGMIGGQSVDVEYTDRPITPEQLDYIHHNKTGALLEASMMIGAILAGANDSDIARVEKIASNIGLAFQIRDDILDEISTTEVLGKPVGSDENNNKTTFVSLYGMKAAEEAVEKLSREAIEELKAIGGEGTFLERLFDYMIGREK